VEWARVVSSGEVSRPARKRWHSRARSHLDTASLDDITSGSDGTCRASVSYLCTSGVGYDGPTGLGSPIGLGAFW